MVAAFSVWGNSYGEAKADRINIDAYDFYPLKTQVVGEMDQLLLSDSPEYINEPGLLAAGTLDGHSRIYFYHVNEQREPQKIALMVENRGKRPVEVEVNRQVISKPDADYFVVGKEVSRKDLDTSEASWQPWLERGLSQVQSPTVQDTLKTLAGAHSKKKKNHSPKKKVEPKKERRISFLEDTSDRENGLLLRPGQEKQIVLELEDVKVKQDQLVSGIVDLWSSEAVYSKVLMLPSYMNTKTVASQLPVQPIDDVELRGTFTGARRLLEVTTTYDTKLGAGAIELANDREDPYVKGYDELSSIPVVNKGNYGITNTLVLHTTGQGAFDMYFNPMGGAFGGTIKITHGGKSKLYALPASGYVIGEGTIYDTMYMDTFHSGGDILVEYMSPGASNLPVRLLLIPTMRK